MTGGYGSRATRRHLRRHGIGHTGPGQAGWHRKVIARRLPVRPVPLRRGGRRRWRAVRPGPGAAGYGPTRTRSQVVRCCREPAPVAENGVVAARNDGRGWSRARISPAVPGVPPPPISRLRRRWWPRNATNSAWSG